MNSPVIFIISTPIGNLKDISIRALEVLRSVDFILAEDTRHTKILLGHYSIQTPLVRYNDYNHSQRIQEIIKQLKEGQRAAMLTDAGTPGISDPAYLLIRSCIKEKVNVTHIPGPSSVITALVESGLPMEKFIFEGFLPRKKGRKSVLEKMAQEQRTIVLFESPERILSTLRDILETCGNRPIAVCKELTKMFEEVFRGTVSESIEHFIKHKPRGEFTIVLGKYDPNVYFRREEKL